MQETQEVSKKLKEAVDKFKVMTTHIIPKPETKPPAKPTVPVKK